MIREKRWAIYVAKATKRFERWWQVSVEPGAEMLNQSTMATEQGLDTNRHPLFFSKKTLPRMWCDVAVGWFWPFLDFVMVWHSSMLNPRDFLEDCIRHQKMNFWREGWPWASINNCIDNTSFEYVASDEARQLFEADTGYSWDSVHDPPNLSLNCSSSNRSLSIPWITCASDLAWMNESEVTGRGFAERDFE